MTTSEKMLPKGGANIPDHAIEAIARCLLPHIRQYFESEEGQQALAQYKMQQENKNK